MRMGMSDGAARACRWPASQASGYAFERAQQPVPHAPRPPGQAEQGARAVRLAEGVARIGEHGGSSSAVVAYSIWMQAGAWPARGPHAPFQRISRRSRYSSEALIPSPMTVIDRMPKYICGIWKLYCGVDDEVAEPGLGAHHLGGDQHEDRRGARQAHADEDPAAPLAGSRA